MEFDLVEMERLHFDSIMAANKAYNEYNRANRNQNAPNFLDALESYKEKRRLIPLGTGVNGGRWGAREAFIVLQEGL
jgi:hypothetical protein